MYKYRLYFLKIIIGVLFCCGYFSIGHAAGLLQLSSNSVVSLIVCSPSSVIENSFGHAAIRVQDSSAKVDVVFNYGSYDPKQDYLVYKILMGTLESSLEGEHFIDFVEEYRRQGRGIKEYYLSLSLKERQRIWSVLNASLISGNRFYKFNFVDNNCTTQTRDLLFEQLGLHADLYRGLSTGHSYREVEFEEPFQNSWDHLLFNLLIGINGDKICSIYQAAFSPIGLVRLLETVQVHERVILMGEHEVLAPTTVKKAPVKSIPVIYFSLLLLSVLIISFFQYKRNFSCIFLDRILFFISGIMGFFIIYLMSFSNVSQESYNLNILWALPTNAILAFSIRKNKNGKWTKALARIAMLSILIFLSCSFMFQYIPIEAYLFSITLLVRLYFYGAINFKCDKNEK